MTEEYDPKNTIFPTYDCFSDALEFIDHVAGHAPEKTENLRLVHAICNQTGQEYSHGWVEDIKKEICIFCGIYMGEKVYFAARFEDFFKAYSVKEATRYTVTEAFTKNLETCHFGPWEEKYSALCGKGGTILGGGQMENVGLIGSLPTKTKKKGKTK